MISGSIAPAKLLVELDAITPENGGKSAFYNVLRRIKLRVIRDKHVALRIKVVEVEIRLELKDDVRVKDTLAWIDAGRQQCLRERPQTVYPTVASIGGHAAFYKR